MKQLIDQKDTQCLSPKGRKTALARHSLLTKLNIYIEAKRKQGVKKTEACKEFVRIYNAGIYAQSIYKILGNVSLQTLYRWRSQLAGTNDWKMLAPNYGSNNRATISEVEAKYLLGFLLHPNKLKIGTSIKFLKYKLQSIGETVKSDITYRRFADDFRKKQHDVWILMREGQKALLDKVAPYIKRDPSMLEVGDVLVADGHRLNFKVINPFTGKPCRATLVGYLDWKSYDLAGYEIMIEENTQCIAAALRNSIIRLGKIPKITYQDNGKAFKARFFTSTEDLEETGINGLFARLGIVPVFATPYNARAKIIERWFRDFSDTFERLLPSFTGSSITDKPAHMLRNEKFHKAIHNEYIPTISEAVQMIEAWLVFHREQPCPHVQGKTIGEVFNEGRGQGVDINKLDDLMMAAEIKNIRQNGIRFLNAEYYDDNLYGLRDRVLIKYSLFNLTYIKVYEMNGRFLCTAKRVEYTHPMSAVMGDENDVESLKQKVSHQRRLRKQTIRLAKDYMIAGGGAPQLDWQKVAKIAPSVIDKLEKENITLPGDERQIPDELVMDMEPAENHVNKEPEQLQFNESWQRYEYLIQQRTLSFEEKKWLNEYMRSYEYLMIYGPQAASE